VYGNPNSLLQGEYSFSLHGQQGSGCGAVGYRGVLTFDGNGGIADGSLTLNCAGVVTEANVSGVYAVGADGAGSISLSGLVTGDLADTFTLAIAVANGGKRVLLNVTVHDRADCTEFCHFFKRTDLKETATGEAMTQH
jgi:hypothetical protein